MNAQFGWIAPDGEFTPVLYGEKGGHGVTARRMVREKGWPAPEWDEQEYLMGRGFIRVDAFYVNPGPPTAAQVRTLLRLRTASLRASDKTAANTITKYLAQYRGSVKMAHAKAALTGDINAKINEGISYLRPIITFLEDGQRGAHVVLQDARRASDVWFDVSQLAREGGDAQLVKYISRVQFAVARALKVAEQANYRIPGTEQTDAERMRQTIPLIKRALAEAQVIARRAGGGMKSARKNARGDAAQGFFEEASRYLNDAIYHIEDGLSMSASTGVGYRADDINRALGQAMSQLSRGYRLVNLPEFARLSDVREIPLLLREISVLQWDVQQWAKNWQRGIETSPNKGTLMRNQLTAVVNKVARLARIFGTGASLMSGKQPTGPYRSVRSRRSMKGDARNIWISQQLNKQRDRIDSLDARLSTPALENEWLTARPIIGEVIGVLVRIQRMLTNDPRFAHDSGSLREAIYRLSQANSALGLQGGDIIYRHDPSVMKVRRIVLRELQTAVGALNSLTH